MVFAKGISGNPNGRTKGSVSAANALAAYISEKTLQGAKIADFLLGVLENGDDNKDRIAAAKLLIEYGIGKPRDPSLDELNESLFGAICMSRGLSEARN